MDKYLEYDPVESQNRPPPLRPNRLPLPMALLVGIFLVLILSLSFPWMRSLVDRLDLRKTTPLIEPSASVWVQKDTGFYVCRDSALYGRQPGRAMSQAEALRSGFRPTAGRYCTSQKRKPLPR